MSHNPVSATLRTDHPQSARDLARMFGLPFVWETFEYFQHTVRTGRPAVEKALPEGVWAWLAERPEASAIFNGAMIGKSFGQVAAVVDTFDFSRFPRIADVGGGRGHLLQAILGKYPQAKGLLFEQPHVIDEVRGIASERLQLQAGDFFTDELPPCDAYILMEVIHDWADDRAAQILSTVRRSAPAGSALLLVEQLMPAIPGPHWVKMLDVHMMALFAARQRCQSEYDRLAKQCGFRPVGTDPAEPCRPAVSSRGGILRRRAGAPSCRRRSASSTRLRARRPIACRGPSHRAGRGWPRRSVSLIRSRSSWCAPRCSLVLE